MKRAFAIVTVLTLVTGISSAQAGNKAVETAIQSHPDLSTFHEALVSTGVLNELKEGEDYTVFAPTNDAFVQIDAHNYPCFYSAQCRAEVAAILRNHIIEDKYHIGELVKRGGNPASTIGKNDLYVEEIFKGSYRAEGRDVLTETETGGSIVYRIDGVIADDDTLAKFHTLKTAIPASDHMPVHPIPGGSPDEIVPAAAAAPAITPPPSE